MMTEQEQDKQDCKIATNCISTIIMIVIVSLIFILFGYFFNAVLEKEKIGVFGVITLSGALGGIVTSLDSNEEHAFFIPFSGNELHSGFIGHCFIGVCGAFVGLSAALLFTPFELSIFWEDSDISHLLKPLIITISIGIIGGFSGLPIISKLSNHAIKKIETAMNEQKVELKNQQKIIQEEKDKNLKQEEDIEKTKLNIDNTMKELNQAKDDLNYNGAMINLNGEKYEVAYEYFKKLNDSDSYKSNENYWINRAYIEKRCGKLTDALSSIDKALVINQNSLYGLYNKMCYVCLLSQDESKFIDLYMKILKLDKDPKFETIKDNISKDPDLEILRKSSAYEEVKSE